MNEAERNGEQTLWVAKKGGRTLGQIVYDRIQFWYLSFIFEGTRSLDCMEV